MAPSGIFLTSRIVMGALEASIHFSHSVLDVIERGGIHRVSAVHVGELRHYLAAMTTFVELIERTPRYEEDEQ